MRAAITPGAGADHRQLIEQIKKWAIAVDPDRARRRYEQAVADRKVVGYRNADGSANLSGYNLPLDRVAAASGHIDALAKTAKRAGDTRTIDHIRADLFLGMTDGIYTGLDDTAIIELLTTTPAPDPDQPHNNGKATRTTVTADPTTTKVTTTDLTPRDPTPTDPTAVDPTAVDRQRRTGR